MLLPLFQTTSSFGFSYTAYSFLSTPSGTKETKTQIIDKRSSSELLMPRLKYLTKLSLWRAKLIHSIHVITGKHRVTSIKTRILRLTRPMTLHLVTSIIKKIEINQDKLQIKPQKIFVQTVEASKTRPPTLRPLAITPLLSRGIKSRMTKI